MSSLYRLRTRRSYVLLPLAVGAALLLAAAHSSIGQPPGGPDGGGGRPGFGRPPGGFGPGSRTERKLLDDFDQNQDGWLNLEERSAARASQQERGEQRRRFGRFGRGRDEGPAAPGPKLGPGDVDQFPDAELYDNSILRTVFIEFEAEDWEQELEAFRDTDVEVPATVTVDGKTYPKVGVHFRGQSSYMMVPRGRKRSLNLSFDFVEDEQRLYGYKTLNLLNCAGDASLMSSVLYSRVARRYIPAPRANFVRVAINGESWGVFANVQQFDKLFLKDNYDPPKGTRWKAPGFPGGDAGLRYLGEDPAEYKQRFQMKSDDGPEAWDALVDLCRTLNETPLEQLEAELSKVLDIDQTLKFLALDVALVNSDGYWTRASDYYLYRSDAGVFQLIPHDMNEAFSEGGHGPPGGRGQRGRRGGRREDPRPGGPGDVADRPPPRGFGPPAGFIPPEGFVPPPGMGPGGFGHGGVDLDPLVGLESDRMPLRSRLLAIPSLREKYLGYVRAIAQDSLDGDELGPFIDSQSGLIDQAVQQDTKKLASYEEFQTAVAAIRDFAQKRRAYLLDYQPKTTGN